MPTIAELKQRLFLYQQAEIRVLEGNQSWRSPEGVEYNRANINALQRGIRDLESRIAVMEGQYGATSLVFGGGGRR